MILMQRLSPLVHQLLEHERLLYPDNYPHLILHSLLSSNQQLLIIPLTASAVLPWHGAEVTKLRVAPTRHVVASVLQFNDRMAPWASLPVLG